MKFYTGSKIITPDFPVLQCGFAARNKKSEGIHDDTYVSIVIIDENETIVLITLDVAYGDKSFAYGIKTAICEKFGIPSENIIISYTHTHSSVAITGEVVSMRNRRPYSLASDRFFFHGDWKDIDDSKDLEYYHHIEKQIIDMMGEGMNNLMEGHIYLNKSSSKLGISRRLPVDDHIELRPYDNDDAMDMDLFMLKLSDNSGKLKGIIYNYACHPTSAGPDNYLISSDVIGVVRTQLKNKYPEVEVIFLQGCGADVKPRFGAVDGYFKSANFERMEKGCQPFISEFIQIIEKGNWRELHLTIQAVEKNFKLYTNSNSRKFYENIINNPERAEYEKESALAVIESIDDGRAADYLPFYINAIKLDKKTCILALENEVASSTGKLIKSSWPDDLIVLGYTNSVCCYIPTEDIIRNGGYESRNYMIARLAGPFVPETESIILGESLKILQKSRNCP